MRQLSAGDALVMRHEETSATLEIIVDDVNDVEARVYARCRNLTRPLSGIPSEPIVVRGTLRGPYCDTARTLPAEFAFRDIGSADSPTAEVVIPDPCVWSPVLPHLYQADVQARQGERVLAEYHGMIGLRSKEPG
jgi:hypothetical protein